MKTRVKNSQAICFMFLFLFFSFSNGFGYYNEHEFLLSTKASIFDPLNFLSNWKNSSSFCSWNGVSCDSNSTHVTRINLSSKNLSGKISESLFKILHVETIDLSNNQLSGGIPTNVFASSSLVHLNLSNNNLTGLIPKGYIPKLEKLDLSNNFLSGAIPEEIGLFSELQYLDLGGNTLVGKIPKSLTNLTKLQDLTLASNQLVGDLPSELGFMKSLKFIYLGYNNFSGRIPNEIGELTLLNHLNLAFNNLTGEIPPSLGNLTELNYLFLYFNKLTGPIPKTIYNLKKLKSLDVSDNLLSGEIPELVSNLRVLEVLHLFSNQFSGKIPTTLCNSGHLQKLILFSNSLEGELPKSLSLCKSLERVRLQNNKLSGQLSPEFIELPVVYFLDLSTNNLSGEINKWKWKMPKLQMLSLSRNKFSGELPDSFGSNKLENLDLSENEFSGNIPPSFGKFPELMELKLSKNKLSGKIPKELSSCKKLVKINFSYNHLTGGIPETLSRLPVLGNLDLSMNQLSGEVPETLGNVESLVEVNISHNYFRGELPSTGVFTAINYSAVTGNNLCGGASGTHLPPCKMINIKNFNWWFFWMALGVVTFAAISIMVVLYVKKRNEDLYKTTRMESEIDGGGEWELLHFEQKASKMLAIDEILQSLRGHKNVIAMKYMQYFIKEFNGINLDNNLLVKIKDFGKIRHTNIAKLVAICMSEKGRLILVREYVEGKKLSEIMGELSWESRGKIAIGIAKALRYLHGCCSPAPVVVGNMSPENVMVVAGKDEACVKLSLPDMIFPDMKCLVSSAYVAPETKEITESSDIYGFGLILIELLTGKTPVDAEIGLHENVVEWARYCYSDCHLEAWVDPLIKVHALKNPNHIVEIMYLALQCTAHDIAARPYAEDVVKRLESIMRSSTLCF
ncbi:putative protein kinase RLK-Pelle-Singleton family [Helianthus annuus]|nr:putative protein kinase RLK-Pelle-Singleton family [Helianthus annuus]